MTHIHPEDRRLKHRRSDCRKGRHDYGESQNIGAGIVRRVCDACAVVTIDLTRAHELTEPLIPNHSSILSMAANRQETT